MENAYDRRERTIYVSGMHRSVTEDHLYDLFQKAGPIEKVILKENQDGSPQHALVVFKNVDSVMYSIAYLQAALVGDQSISIRPLRESTHHSALETAMARMASPGSGCGSPVQQQQQQQMTPSPTSNTHQAPYFLRSHSRLLQQQHQQQMQQQQQQIASGGGATTFLPTVSQQPQYTGPVGSSLFAPMSFGSSYGSGTSSPYNSAGSVASRSQLYSPMQTINGGFSSSYRASPQSAPGYGRFNSSPYK